MPLCVTNGCPALRELPLPKSASAPRSAAARRRRPALTSASWMTVVSPGVVVRMSAMLVAVVGLLSLAPAPARAAEPVAFAHGATRLVVTAPGYTLALSARNGKILELDDRAAGRRLTGTAGRCLWGAIPNTTPRLSAAARFAPANARRFTYRWNAARATLTMTYAAAHFGAAVVTVHACRRPSTCGSRWRTTAGCCSACVFRTASTATRARSGGLRAERAAGRAAEARVLHPHRHATCRSIRRAGHSPTISPRRGRGAPRRSTPSTRGPLRPAQLGFAHRVARSAAAGRRSA